MAAKLGVLIIHGVGSPRKKYAHPMIEDLKRKIRDSGADPGQICWQAVDWDKVLRDSEDKVCDRLKQHSIWHKLRRLVTSHIGDVTAYRQVPYSSGTYDKIHGVVHEAINKLRAELGDDDKPLIVMAHSMGSVIMSNYIYDRQKKYQPEKYGETKFELMDTLAGFITFGSPIPLFALACDPITAIKFPPEALPEYLKGKNGKAKWLNFFCPADVLAWPLRKYLGDSYKVAVTEDIEIRVGWTPLCHKSYWTNDKFTTRVAQHISEILKACP